MYVLLAVVGLLAAVSAKDLTVGQEGGSLKYEQNITASPTVWRQVKNVTINVTESEVISQIVIVDQREDKNGEATIVEGGEGHQNVTIQLKSPAVFRGFDFLVQVYAKEEGETQSHVGNDQQTVQKPLVQDTDVNDKQTPQKETKDVIIGSPVSSTSTTLAPNGQDKVQHPVVIGQNDKQQVRTNRNVQQTEQKPVQKPTTNDKDWQGMIDDIFTENKPGSKQTKPTDTKKSVTEPEKPVEDLDDSQQVKTSTTKTVKGQQAEKPVEVDGSQQVKQRNVVPLPYAKQ